MNHGEALMISSVPPLCTCVSVRVCVCVYVRVARLDRADHKNVTPTGAPVVEPIRIANFICE